MSAEFAELFSMGLVLGLAAGFGPGPLATMVISEALRHGTLAGAKVALGPLITDAPIIIVALFVLSRVPNQDVILGVLSLIGAVVLFYFGVKAMRAGPLEISEVETKPRSLQKGMIVNALNPHPYIFWFTIGGPTIVRASSVAMAAAFVVPLFVCLVGGKALIAVAVGRSRGFLSGRAYVVIEKALGIALCVYAVLLVRDGINLLRGGG